MAPLYLHEEFDPARWEELLCPEMRACMAIIHAEGNAIARLGSENVKAPVTTAILQFRPGEATLAKLRAEAVRLGTVNVIDDGAGCTEHFTGLDWSEPEPPRPDGKARLRARLGLTPDVAAAVTTALLRDERPLRDAYARVRHTTVADMRERLAEPGDHDRLVWPTLDDYRASVLRSCKALRRRDLRLVREHRGAVIERVWRIAGINFAEVITRERDGLIREVEFVGSDRTGAPAYPGLVVRIA